MERIAESSRKRKRTQQRALDKGKKIKRGAKKWEGSDGDSGDEYNDDLAQDMYRKSAPLPGQLENCELCSKRFTVTPYSKTGLDGGLLCNPCGKESAADSKPDKKGKKPVAGRKRRKLESDRLDGIVTHGAKTLQQLCVEKVAQHHTDVEEFGDIPEVLLDRLSEIFSKQRVLNPKTLGLFLRPDLETVAIHDCACEYIHSWQVKHVFCQQQG